VNLMPSRIIYQIHIKLKLKFLVYKRADIIKICPFRFKNYLTYID